jgi:hypothetical protein
MAKWLQLHPLSAGRLEFADQGPPMGRDDRASAGAQGSEGAIEGGAADEIIVEGGDDQHDGRAGKRAPT